jgi:hypothetical protein
VLKPIKHKVTPLSWASHPFICNLDEHRSISGLGGL